MSAFSVNMFFTICAMHVVDEQSRCYRHVASLKTLCEELAKEIVAERMISGMQTNLPKDLYDELAHKAWGTVKLESLRTWVLDSCHVVPERVALFHDRQIAHDTFLHYALNSEVGMAVLGGGKTGFLRGTYLLRLILNQPNTSMCVMDALSNTLLRIIKIELSYLFPAVEACTFDKTGNIILLQKGSYNENEGALYASSHYVNVWLVHLINLKSFYAVDDTLINLFPQQIHFLYHLMNARNKVQYIVDNAAIWDSLSLQLRDRLSKKYIRNTCLLL